ncbi:hypothetical protein ACFX19_002802 [Malus domestica]
MKRNAAHNPNKAKLSNPKFDYCVLEVNDEFMLIILIPENLTSTAVIRWKRREEAALCQPEKMTEVLRGLLWVDVGAVWVWVWLVVVVVMRKNKTLRLWCVRMGAVTVVYGANICLNILM